MLSVVIGYSNDCFPSLDNQHVVVVENRDTAIELIKSNIYKIENDYEIDHEDISDRIKNEKFFEFYATDNESYWYRIRECTDEEYKNYIYDQGFEIDEEA